MRTQKNLDFFRAKCKEHKLKLTPQRIAIYEELTKSKDHPVAEKLFHAVSKKFPYISLDTVYRTLLTFVQIGIADMVEGYGNQRRFDPNTNTHHHAHCLKCGKIIDFSSTEYDKLEVPRDIQEEFTVTSKKVVIKGICRKCQQES